MHVQYSSGGASQQAKFLEWASTLWAKMLDRDDASVSMTHNGYLKKYQLQRPKLGLKYDCVMLDESQDATPVRMHNGFVCV